MTKQDKMPMPFEIRRDVTRFWPTSQLTGQPANKTINWPANQQDKFGIKIAISKNRAKDFNWPASQV